jgi:hypothetical protein
VKLLERVGKGRCDLGRRFALQTLFPDEPGTSGSIVEGAFKGVSGSLPMISPSTTPVSSLMATTSATRTSPRRALRACRFGRELSSGDLGRGGPCFCRTDFYETNFEGACLNGATYRACRLAKTNLTEADLRGCSAFGLSAWDFDAGGASRATWASTTKRSWAGSGSDGT